MSRGARSSTRSPPAQLAGAQSTLKALVWRVAGGDAAPAAPTRSIAPGPTPSGAPLPGPTPPGTSIGVPADPALAALATKLVSAFAEFGAPIELDGDPVAGPSCIRFLAKPQRGVTVRALTRLGESAWMRLGTSQPPHVSLERMVEEMERRYEALARAGADDLAEYNARSGAVLPRIVCVCDEYADLLLADRKRREAVEQSVARLGAKARAASSRA